MLENIFHLKENHTDVKTEVMAGYHDLYDDGLHSGGQPQHPVRFRHGTPTPS